MSGDFKPLWAPSPSPPEEKQLYEEWKKRKDEEYNDEREKNDRVIVIDI